MIDAGAPYEPVVDFHAHVPRMAGFHRRHMASNHACRWRAQRARRLDIDMIVPQRGLPIRGADSIRRFIDWVESLVCGVDLLQDESADALL